MGLRVCHVHEGPFEELEVGHDSIVYENDPRTAAARELVTGPRSAQKEAADEEKELEELDGRGQWQWRWPGGTWLRNDPSALQRMRDLVMGSERSLRRRR